MPVPAPAPVSLVVTDLDGTLWHTDDHIDGDVVAAMGELAERGIPLLVATGRRLTSTRVALARVRATPPAVLLNGALGVDLATGDRFHRAPYPTAQAIAVQAAFASVGLAPVVYVDHPGYDVFLGPAPSTHPDHARRLGDRAGVDDLARVAAEEAVLGFGMIGVPHREGATAREAIGDLAACHLDRALDYAGMASLMVAPRGLSKWNGVLAYCAAHGIDPRRVLAVADGPNDIELLDHASVRLVPEVAHPAALERADHLIPAAAQGGWRAVLDHIG